jgi:catechol 2,3-dioxygenase-like lactoylglutathione lyase family enzyme
MSRIFGPIDQICWVVPDIQTSMTYWAETLGVGPWFWMPRLRPDDFEYRGEPSDAEISIAIAYSGRMQLELIEQHNDAPSMYKDSIDAGRVPGQHHLGFFRRDYDERLEQALAAGYRVGHSGSLGDRTVRFAYLMTEEEPGMIAELIELTDPSEATFVTMHQASIDWDGSDPIRGGPA